MSTPNHDTELEEILEDFAFETDGEFDCGHDGTFDVPKTVAALHTYLYKQTLEDIGQDEEELITGRDGLEVWEDYEAVIRNAFRAQLRKAAAERWGQE